MNLTEFLLYTTGEFNDIVACYQIANGIADYKEPQKNDFIPNWS